MFSNIFPSDISLPVQLTPYGVTIRPDADWREDGHFYYVIATDTDGKFSKASVSVRYHAFTLLIIRR